MNFRSRRGATLIEAVLALGLTAVVLATFVMMASDFSERQKSASTALRLTEVKSAAESYLRANTQKLLDLTVTNPVVVGVAKLKQGGADPGGPTGLTSLQGGGFLPDGFIDSNPYGQSHAVIVRRVSGTNRLEAVVTSVGGRTIPDRSLGTIATGIGAEGGFVASAGPAASGVPKMVGTSGGWAAPVGTWTAGGISPSAGHVVAAIALDDGSVVGDYVNRRDVGIPEANRMRTNLSMGGNSAVDVAALVNGQASVVLDKGSDAATSGKITVGRDLTVDGAAEATVDAAAGRDMRGKQFVDTDKASAYFADPASRQKFFDLEADYLDTEMTAYGTDMSAYDGGPSVTAASATRKLGSYLRHDVTMVKSVDGPLSTGDPGATGSATAYCPADYIRISCAGGRSDPLKDTCGEETCGYIGTIPVESGGRQGCQTAIDQGPGTRPMAVAFCMSNVEGGTGGTAPGVGGSGDAPVVETCPAWAPGVHPDCKPILKCPEWAPGTYPTCIYPSPDVCPDWAPGIYPKCIVNKCPPWAPGAYPACNTTPPCVTPWGTSLPHGQSVPAYQSPSVPYGGTCIGQTRSCSRGLLSGSYVYPSCSVTPPASCPLPWGGSIAHGQSTPAYLAGSVPFGGTCTGQTRTCNNGNLGGSYVNPTCAPIAPSACNLPWGGIIGHGASVNAYLTVSVAFGGSCSGQVRTCSNGTLSGSYANPSCAPVQPSACSLPWGGSIAHGASTTAYAAGSVPFGSSCASQTRTCSNGTLTGTYASQSCAPVQPAACALPWGGSIAHGTGVTAYATPSVGFGQGCTAQARICSNGSLSGSFVNPSCAPNAPANCTAPWGAAVAHGGFVTAYASATVPAGSSCTPENRVCSNGGLGGSYQNQSCTVLQPTGSNLYTGFLHNAGGVITWADCKQQFVPSGSAAFCTTNLLRSYRNQSLRVNDTYPVGGGEAYFFPNNSTVTYRCMATTTTSGGGCPVR
jgi:hypothetical protein